MVSLILVLVIKRHRFLSALLNSELICCFCDGDRLLRLTKLFWKWVQILNQISLSLRLLGISFLVQASFWLVVGRSCSCGFWTDQPLWLTSASFLLLRKLCQGKIVNAFICCSSQWIVLFATSFHQLLLGQATVSGTDDSTVELNFNLDSKQLNKEEVYRLFKRNNKEKAVCS